MFRWFKMATFFFVLALPAFGAPGPIRRVPEPVTGEYVVVLSEHNPHAVPGLATSVAAAYNAQIRFIYDEVVGGFACTATEDAAQRMNSDPRVEWIEESAVVHTDAVSAVQTTSASLWYLDRLDQRWLTGDGQLSGTYNYGTTGYGVRVYMIDEGINAAHSQFIPGRVLAGADFVNPEAPEANSPCQDVEFGWHGTATASMVAGQTYGTAKDAILVPVRAMNCQGYGTTARLVAAFNWVVSKTTSPNPDFATIPTNPDADIRPAVVNYSGWWTRSQFDSYYQTTVEIAVNSLVNRGITVLTSANNFNDDACNRTPANLARGGPGATVILPNLTSITVPGRVITVGGTMIGNTRYGTSTGDYRWQEYEADGVTEKVGNMSGSSWGRCVSIFAPAKNILAAHHLGGIVRASGTSFSSPLVAGLAARFLQGTASDPDNFTSAMPGRIWDTLSNTATVKQIDGTTDLIQDTKGSPSRMAYFPYRARPIQ